MNLGFLLLTHKFKYIYFFNDCRKDKSLVKFWDNNISLSCPRAFTFLFFHRFLLRNLDELFDFHLSL